MYAGAESPRHQSRLAFGRGNLATPPGMDHRYRKTSTKCVNQFQTFLLSEFVLHYNLKSADLEPDRLLRAMDSISLAYALVALCYLCPEAERYATVLNLDGPTFMDRRNFGTSPCSGKERLLALLTTTNYCFGFHEDGSLHTVYKKGLDSYNLQNHDELLAQQTSGFDSNAAYSVALRWLDSLELDTNRLSRDYSYTLFQPEIGKGRAKKPVPLFFMNWISKTNTHKYDQALNVELAPGPRLFEITIEDRSLCRRPHVRVPGELVLMRLPNEPFTNLWMNRGINVSNVYDILHTSTAYQARMLSNMLVEANWEMAQLRLGEIRKEELLDSFVVPPRFGMRGCLETKTSFFEFDEVGRLYYFLHTYHGTLNSFTAVDYEADARFPSLVNSNNVVELARNVLRNLDVDVDGLDKAATAIPSVYLLKRKRITNLWFAYWLDEGSHRNLAYVHIDGTHRGAQRIQIEDKRFLRRTLPRVDDASELMATPDGQPQRNPLRAHLNVWPELFQNTN